MSTLIYVLILEADTILL